MSKGGQLALTISLSVLGGLLIGGVAVFLWFTLTAEKQSATPSSATQQQNVSPTTGNVPSNTYTRPSTPKPPAPAVLGYTNEQYGVEFTYPEAWVGANEDPLTAEESPLFGFAETDVQFASVEDGVPGVRITSMDDLESVDYETVNDALSNLRSAYSSRSVSPIRAGQILVPINAGAYYFTTPQYIESADGSFRGYYYYGLFGNGSAPEDSPVLLPTLHVELTDGDAIVQITATTERTAPSGSVACDGMESLVALDCVLPTRLSTTVSDDLFAIIDSLQSV